jgi:hypothetical protein
MTLWCRDAQVTAEGSQPLLRANAKYEHKLSLTLLGPTRLRLQLESCHPRRIRTMTAAIDVNDCYMVLEDTL